MDCGHNFSLFNSNVLLFNTIVVTAIRIVVFTVIVRPLNVLFRDEEGI